MLDIVAPSCYSCRALVIHLFFVPFESTYGRYFRMWRYAFMRLLNMFCLVLFLATATLILFHSRVASAQDSPSRIGERPALEGHVNQIDIESGKIKFDDLLEIGEEIFAARWTSLDGQGRPAATGAGAPTKRNPLNNIPFIRTSGPEIGRASCRERV